MDTSFFLARVMGITMAVLYIGALIHFKTIQRSLKEVEEHPVILFVSGFIALVLGLLVIQVHNIWVWNWKVIITLLGWIMIVVGAIRILVPNAAIRLGHILLARNANIAYLIFIFMAVVGAYLAIMGFWGL